MKRDLLVTGALWLVLTVVGEVLAYRVDIYPVARSDKGQEIEDAFRALVYLAVPVFTMVVSVLLYTVLRHRSTGPADGEENDGPAFAGRGPVPLTWLGMTAGLTVLVMIYPGLTGIPKIVNDQEDPQLLVQVDGVQWSWLVSYPQYDVAPGTELVLPVNRTVRFNITSRDVLHSFWIPAFLMKIDAVPGKTTGFSLKPTETGAFDSDPLLRVQCAELCGLSHSRMTIPVSVVSDEEFRSWLDAHQKPAATPAATPSAEAQELTITSKNSALDTTEATVRAGRQVIVRFQNEDGGVFHNWALYESEEAAKSGAKAIAASELKAGPVVQEVVMGALEAGAYYFRCDVHPTTMYGVLVAQ